MYRYVVRNITRGDKLEEIKATDDKEAIKFFIMEYGHRVSESLILEKRDSQDNVLLILRTKMAINFSLSA